MTEPTSMSEAYREMHLGTRQANLDNFEKIVSSYSDPDHAHVLQKIEGRWTCSCRGYEQWGHCHHASKEIQKEAIARKDYCAIIMDLRSHARYRSFEGVLDAFASSRDEEFTLLCAVVLGLAYEGTVDADMVHYKCKERFVHDSRIVGSVFGYLKRLGYLTIMGMKKSERNINHHRTIATFNLTDKGKNYLNGGSQA
jgi:hypothetical protein